MTNTDRESPPFCLPSDIHLGFEQKNEHIRIVFFTSLPSLCASVGAIAYGNKKKYYDSCSLLL